MAAYAATGCTRSFDELYRRYAVRLRKHAAGSIRDEAEAEDLAHVAWVRVISHRTNYDPARAFRPWIFSILNNLIKNYYRALERRLVAPRTELVPDEAALDFADQVNFQDPLLNPIDPRQDPESQAYGLQLDQLYAHALNELPESERTPFLLHYEGGLTYEATAARLSIPCGTAKSRAHRALLFLQARFRDLGPFRLPAATAA